MARSLRIERSNGVYHIINRGNYRQDLFINEGAHNSFESCLFEACEKCGWILEGFCVMTNHFHLIIRTPEGNLVYGMKWLQATFANRYHRFRKLQGKLFQGRYKSLIVEEDLYLGGLQHYVHLNPVRAGMCSIESLKDYRWSSFWYLNHPSKRPSFLDLSGALEHAGGLKDSPIGRRKYVEYLSWLSSNGSEQKKLAFSKMCHGWALGTKEYKKKLLETEGLLKDGSQQALRLEGKELREANELQWEHLLERGLVAVDKTPDDIFGSRKSADWKVWIAYYLKRHSSASNVWISVKLNMGAPQAVSLHTGRFDPHGATSKKGYNGFVQRFTK
jgi:REP element-mobilizing transposase RayT